MFPTHVITRPISAIVVLVAVADFVNGKAAAEDAPRPTQANHAPDTAADVPDAPIIKSYPILEARREITRRVTKSVASANDRGTHFGAGSDDETLVYSNTLGHFVLPLLRNGLIADDLTLLVGAGCSLSRYEFYVTGRADPEMPAGAYQLEYALYDNCPSAGAAMIVGTDVMNFCNGAIHGLMVIEGVR